MSPTWPSYRGGICQAAFAYRYGPQDRAELTGVEVNADLIEVKADTARVRGQAATVEGRSVNSRTATLVRRDGACHLTGNYLSAPEGLTTAAPGGPTAHEHTCVIEPRIRGARVGRGRRKRYLERRRTAQVTRGLPVDTPDRQQWAAVNCRVQRGVARVRDGV